MFYLYTYTGLVVFYVAVVVANETKCDRERLCSATVDSIVIYCCLTVAAAMRTCVYVESVFVMINIVVGCVGKGVRRSGWISSNYQITTPKNFSKKPTRWFAILAVGAIPSLRLPSDGTST